MCGTTCWKTFQDTFMLGMGSSGLIVYLIVLIVLIKYSKTTFKKPFFTLCISLGIVEVFGLFKYLTEPAVLLYMSKNKDDEIFQRVWGGLGRVPWYAVLYHQLFIALERMTSLLYPKVHQKIWTKRAMYVHYTIISVLSLASNLCICTEYCAYVLYTDGVTNFYNMSIPGAVLHNKIVDFGIQPFVVLVIVGMYMITGFKIIRLRRQIRSNTGQSKSDATARKKRLEIMLVVQGVLISAPQSITAALYHVNIYIPLLPDTAKFILGFIQAIASKMVFASSPFFYLALNTDMRVKLATMLAGQKAVVNAVSVAPISMAPTKRY